MKNNLFEIKTTLSGFLVILLAGFYYFAPWFSDRQLWEASNNIAIGIFLVGLLLLLAPDKLIDFITGFISKRLGNNEKNNNTNSGSNTLN